MRILSTCLPIAFASILAAVPASATDLKGHVLGAGAPIANSTVALWAASAGEPKQLAQTKSGSDGRFELGLDRIGVRIEEVIGKDVILYLVAKGGMVAAAKGSNDNPAIGLMTVLNDKPPSEVVINELTTVASAFTAARFINGQSISGNPLGLRIAAGNAPNLVDPATGGWGKVLLDPLNSTQTTTLATLNTLGSLVAATFTVANDDWRARFYKAATPPSGVTPQNTIEAIAGIAREPWAQSKDLYALFDEAYPQPKDGSRRTAPFLPYLSYAPPDFALMLNFAGGGMLANGKYMFDAEGNLWSGQNWMPGSQSGVNKSIGGGVIKFAPNGTALSPAITGFTGMGIDGIGWGTAVTRDKVWATSFNGSILVMDLDGHPIGEQSDIPIVSQLRGLMGVGVAANGDVWIADASGNQLVYFPGGQVKDGRIVKVEGLKSPFGVAIDAQNRVWVSNSQSDTVVRFPANDPSKVETFRAGIAVRGIALDSKGNLWAASNMSLDFPPPKIPDGASAMLQFQLAVENLQKVLTPGKTTGVVNMIRPDGTQPAPMGFTGNGVINVPWGLNIDGNDDVWVAGFWARNVVLMAGAGTNGHSAGTKPGDIIHVFQGGGIQINTDVQIDPAGNVWSANNWNFVEAAMAKDPVPATSTWGGGSGLTVIYGVAAPVKAPLMGEVRQP